MEPEDPPTRMRKATQDEFEPAVWMNVTNEFREAQRSARNVLRTIVAAAVLVALFLGVVTLSGCDIQYLPTCTHDCQAAGGSHAPQFGGID